MVKKLYGQSVPPACGYCEKGESLFIKNKIFCKKKGVVPDDYYCRRFKYDPIKRVPKVPKQIEKFDAKDFEL